MGCFGVGRLLECGGSGRGRGRGRFEGRVGEGRLGRLLVVGRKAAALDDHCDGRRGLRACRNGCKERLGCQACSAGLGSDGVVEIHWWIGPKWLTEKSEVPDICQRAAFGQDGTVPEVG